MADFLQLIRGEYLSIPGLCLTTSQVQRFWNLDAAMCEQVLNDLEAFGILRRTHTGGYVKADTCNERATAMNVPADAAQDETVRALVVGG